MRAATSLLSRYANLLFGKPSAIAPLCRADLRRRLDRPAYAAAELLEERALLSGFAFGDFSGAAGLNLEGAASITAGSRLQLTPATGGQSGAAWYGTEQQFVAGAFSTTFQFQMADNFDSPGGSDGFTFAIQNSNPTFVGGGGGNLGYNGLADSLVVEFDTYQSSEFGDTSGSHISVHTAGVGANKVNESFSLGSYNTNPIMDDANIHTARITYQPGTLSIFLDDLTTPKLTVAVDLADKLALADGRAWVGFTAATGGGWQTHDILNWSLDAPADPATIISIGNASQLEGNAGTSNLTFTVTRSGDTSGTTTLDWATANGTAVAGSDYIAASGQLTFNALETTKSITVAVKGDTAIEANETFTVLLSNAVNGSITDGTGTGTILNDETAISINDVSATEGSSAVRFLDDFVSTGSGGLTPPRNVLFGPDGNLYVASRDTDAVHRYDGSTGAFIDTFVTSGSGGLDNPWAMAFGPDGNLYVSGVTSNSVVRYDGTTGAFIDQFIPSGGFGLQQPKGLAFGTDGNLYVSSTTGGAGGAGPHLVLRVQGPLGASPGSAFPAPGQSGAVFISDGSGGLNNPNGLAFGPDGNLYVASTFQDSINRYHGSTGAFLNLFVAPGSGGVDAPNYVAFRPDGLYVTSQATNQVLRYNASNGAFVDTVVSAGSGGLAQPTGLAFDSSGHMYVSSAGTSQVLRYGRTSEAAFTVSLNAPSPSSVTVAYSTASGSALSGADFAAVSGTVTFAPGQTTRTILVSTLDDLLSEGTESFVVNLSSPTGAILADGQGTGTILDNETKFFVVNDGTSDRTFEYSTSGTSVEDYALGSGNTAPRGAASNATGTKVWVVDANSKVYVYDTAGGLLGSWTAGSLPANAQVEGIATNGTDVWILDNKGDKVYRYTGAATRLSGSQTAASSFSLNGSNTNGKGIVTDGTSFWVVDDGATKKVFKYTVAGALHGSWTIDAANSLPTGITIDPNNVSNIWIVDSGAKKVFQYNGGAGAGTNRTSGSQSAAASFNLTAGNTNPQDIADPPAGTGTPLTANFDGASPSNHDLDALFAALAANFDLHGDDDGPTHAGTGRSRGRARQLQRAS